MLDNKPKDYTDITEWFYHFRMTKHLPGMPMKLKDAMAKVPDDKSARFVMTAYAAAALDVAFFIHSRPFDLARELEFSGGIKPSFLTRLSVNEIAQPMRLTAEELAVKLTAGGFKIGADGIISGFEQPQGPPAAKPYRAPQPTP